MIKETIDKTREALPHGSDINDEWKITVYKDKITCKNSYDFMTENGYYDDNFPFTVTYTKKDMKLHFNKLSHKQYYRIRNEQLRDYLEETLYQAFEPISKLLP